MALLPEFIGYRFPGFRVFFALVAEMICALRILVIGVNCAGLCYQLPELFRIFQHRAGTQMVVVERLVVMVSLEDRASQSIQQTAVVNIYVGLMDKYAGLHITFRVDM